MARYFLYLRQSGHTFPDPEGVDRDHVEDVRPIAITAARDIMAADIVVGVLDWTGCIDICDCLGKIVVTISFRDVVMVTGQSPPE